MNPLFTPSASPCPRPSAPPAKRPRLTRNIDSTLSDIDFHAARRESSKRVLDVWSSLAARYSRSIDEDDIINIATGKVVKDRGVLRSSSKLKFGFLVDPEDVEEDTSRKTRKSREASTPSSDGVTALDEEYDELDAFAPSSTLDAEIERVKEVLVPPPAPNPFDEEDLRAFLEADKVINAELDESFDEEESDGEPCELTGAALVNEDDEDSEESEGQVDAGPSEWETSDIEEPPSATFERSSPPIPPDPNEESEDELGKWEIGSSCATPPPLTSSPSGPSRTSSPPVAAESSDDSDIEIIGFSIKPSHLPPLRRPSLSLPSPPRSTSTTTSLPHPIFNAIPSTPQRTKAPALSKSTVKPKSKAAPRDMRPPAQLQTPPRSSVSLNESTPEPTTVRPRPKPLYKGVRPASPTKKLTNAPRRSPSPPSPFLGDTQPRFSSPLPSLFPEPPDFPGSSRSKSRTVASSSRKPLLATLSNPPPLSAIPKPPLAISTSIPGSSSSTRASPPRPQSRPLRGTTRPPEVVITTSARSLSRLQTPAPRFTAQEKGKARETTPPPQTPPPSSLPPKALNSRHSPTSRRSPILSTPPRPPRAGLSQAHHPITKRKRIPSSSSSDGSPLLSPSKPVSRKADGKTKAKSKKAPSKVVSPLRRKSDNQASDSDSDLNAKPTFPQRSRSRGRSQHPTFPFPTYSYTPPYLTHALNEDAKGSTYRTPYGQSIQDPRAQLIISAAMQQLSSLVNGGGGPYSPSYHHNPPPPHHYPHHPAPLVHSTTWPSYPGHPDPPLHYRGITPYENGKRRGQSSSRCSTPSPSPPRPTKDQPRSKSLVKRGRSRGRRVSFKLASDAEAEVEKGRRREKADLSPIHKSTKDRRSGIDSAEEVEDTQNSSPGRGRRIERNLDRMQTPGPPLRSKSVGKGR